MSVNSYETFLVDGVDYKVHREGAPFHMVRGHENADRDDGVRRKYVMLLLSTDVREGDELVNVLTEERLVVEKVRKRVVQGQVEGIDAYYLDERDLRRRTEERRSTQIAGPTFHLGTNYGIVGAQTNARQDQVFDMRSLEAEIDRRGEDVAELRDLVRKLEDSLARDAAPRGALLQFSGLLEKHSWITGSLAAAVISHLTK